MDVLAWEWSWSAVGPTMLFGLLFLVFYEVYRFLLHGNRFPPGPRPWPLLGNIPQLLMKPAQTFAEIATYGEIASLYLGRKPSIVLNTLQVSKMALVENGAVFSGRPSLPVLDWIINGRGIVMSNGDSWRQQRKFASLTLKAFGLGKKSLEERVTEEAYYLIDELEKEGENPFDPQHMIQNAVSNIICSVVFGGRYDYEDKRFHNLLDIINENIFLTGSALGQIFNLFPFIKHFPGPHQRIQQNASELTGFISEEAREHRKTLDKDNLRDFIDAYLVQMEKESIPNSTFFEENMVFSVADLFLAGTDTTSTTIRWGLIYMMEHPHIQEQCHKEIEYVLGFDRIPSMDDRAALPYVYATVHEVQRVGNIVPLGLIHSTTQATQLKGYYLHKGTNVLVNLTAILKDKDHWKYPDTFNPANFLDEKGQFCKNESFLAFSLGPRVCLGEQLARMELFVVFTALLQRLHFSWPPNTAPHDTEGVFGLTRSPKPFKMLCRRRGAKH
ncbi:cytochrome P450 2B4 isoform X2 [Esox lucius]|uniref:cytochrome P450 2B4 isoform X2 n=1 Tax=Esox lucius TaxID=8010 RepID=UPI0005766436|nr:cytochrome P450 2B4 isoform X2 [Esox lucius]